MEDSSVDERHLSFHSSSEYTGAQNTWQHASSLVRLLLGTKGPAAYPPTVEFVFFSMSAANTVNFTSHILRAAKGTPEKLKTNCGLDPNGITPKPIDQEWTNKGISIAAITCKSLPPTLLAFEFS